MKSGKNVLLKSAIILTTLCIALNVQAGVLTKMKSLAFWTRQWPETLIVAGNYAKPRLLAEQAQRKTDLPILVISPETTGDEIYFLPEKPEDTLRVENDKLLEFIDIKIRPKRVVFLGDEEYMPKQYVDLVSERYATIVISGEDWIKNAQQLGKIIGYRRLSKHYRKSLIQLIEADANQPGFEPEGAEFIVE